MRTFIFKKVTNDNELEEVYRLRYKVYCDEWGYEKPEDHPGGIEIDEYDRHSTHFIAIDDTPQIIGTVRLIMNFEEGFPIEKHSTIEADISNINRDKLAEISRLAVSKEYRKRAEDRYIHEGVGEVSQEVSAVPNERRKRQAIVVGLYKSIYIESKRIGLTHWYAVMAKGLYLLLKRLGLVFVPAGPEVFYHGYRTPYIVSIEDLEREVARTCPELLQELAGELAKNIKSQ